jgi:hypothetical protein
VLSAAAEFVAAPLPVAPSAVLEVLTMLNDDEGREDEAEREESRGISRGV